MLYLFPSIFLALVQHCETIPIAFGINRLESHLKILFQTGQTYRHTNIFEKCVENTTVRLFFEKHKTILFHKKVYNTLRVKQECTVYLIGVGDMTNILYHDMTNFISQ